MKKRKFLTTAIICAAVLLFSSAGCADITESKHGTEITESSIQKTTATENTEQEKTAEIKEVSLESIISASEEYLGVKNDVVNWQANLEDGKYGPASDDEDFVFIYPQELLDKMGEERRLPGRENISDYIKIDMYRTSDDTAAISGDDSVWLTVSAVRFRDITEEGGKLKLYVDNVAAGLTADSHEESDKYTYDTGDIYCIEYTANESGGSHNQFRYLYGDDIIITGQLDITSDDIENFDKRTLDDIRCFFESLGLRNPLEVKPSN